MEIAEAGGPARFFHFWFSLNASCPSKPRLLRLGWESTIVRLPLAALPRATDSHAGSAYDLILDAPKKPLCRRPGPRPPRRRHQLKSSRHTRLKINLFSGDGVLEFQKLRVQQIPSIARQAREIFKRLGR